MPYNVHGYRSGGGERSVEGFPKINVASVKETECWFVWGRKKGLGKDARDKGTFVFPMDESKGKFRRKEV